MPIMLRPDSQAKAIHKNVIRHSQKYGSDSPLFELESMESAQLEKVEKKAYPGIQETIDPLINR